MRVIAGSAKGRRLRSLRGQAIRPTADRVKEGLYSMLGSRVDFRGAHVLDLFAGTGSVGIEALSREAASAVFVEQRSEARRVLQANLAQCGFDRRARVVGLPVVRALRRLKEEGERFGLVFIDPPYGRGLAAATLVELVGVGILEAGAWVVVESHVDDELSPTYGSLRLTRTQHYGKTAISLFCDARSEAHSA